MRFTHITICILYQRYIIPLIFRIIYEFRILYQRYITLLIFRILYQIQFVNFPYIIPMVYKKISAEFLRHLLKQTVCNLIATTTTTTKRKEVAYCCFIIYTITYIFIYVKHFLIILYKNLQVLLQHHS